MKVECEICGGDNATESLQKQEVNDGIIVEVPVVSCPDCGLNSTDHRAEDIRRAVAKYPKPDEMAWPVSDCCSYPPIGDTELCRLCKCHCGWHDEGELEDDSAPQPDDCSWW